MATPHCSPLAVAGRGLVVSWNSNQFGGKCNDCLFGLGINNFPMLAQCSGPWTPAQAKLKGGEWPVPHFAL